VCVSTIDRVIRNEEIHRKPRRGLESCSVQTMSELEGLRRICLVVTWPSGGKLKECIAQCTGSEEIQKFPYRTH